MATKNVPEGLTGPELEEWGVAFASLPEKVREIFATSVVGEQFVDAPASSRRSFHSCFAGGLIRHTLNVRRNLHALAARLGFMSTTRSTLDLVSTCHDLGKAGTRQKPYYVQVPAGDDWRRRRGELYDVDEDLARIPVPRLSLLVLQDSGARISEEEYLAISSLDQKSDVPRYGEPPLGLLLGWAKRWAIEQEKGLVSPLPSR